MIEDTLGGQRMKHPSIPFLTTSMVILSFFSFSPTARAESMTTAAAIDHALAQNPSLRASVLDLRAAREAVRSAEAVHRPTMQVGLDGGRNESLSATQSGVAPNANNSVGLDVGMSYASKVGTALSVEVGGSWNAREVNRDPTTTANVDIGSAYSVDATVGVTQPLLRGAGRDVGEADIRSARLSRTVAEHDRDAAASELVRDVMGAYWDLWYAQETLRVNQAARELAEQQASQAEAKVRALGILAQVDALRFASELASIEEQVTSAEADRRARAIELGRLLGREPIEAADIGAATSLADGAAETASLPAADQLVAAAREASSELQALEAQLEVARSRVRVARDATLPRLDLSASFAVGGAWNEETIETGDLPNGRPALSGQLGLELELPLGNGRARADLAEARLQVEAAEARLEASERRIAGEVVTQLDALRSARRRAELAQQSVAVARQLAEAEQEALRLGTATALQVLEAQASLRETELRYLRTLVDRASAEAVLDHLTGRLLEGYVEQSESREEVGR